MAIQFDRAVPIFRIFSIDKAREFYLDFLGFKIDWEHRFEPDFPVYMQVSRDGLAIHLSEHHGDGTPSCSLRDEPPGRHARSLHVTRKVRLEAMLPIELEARNRNGFRKDHVDRENAEDGHNAAELDFHRSSLGAGRVSPNPAPEQFATL